MNKKTAPELLTHEWLEEAFLDINRQLPDSMDRYTHNNNKIRLLRERILARLAEA